MQGDGVSALYKGVEIPDDDAARAKALTTDIFRRQAEDPMLSRAQALRQAMLALIDGPGHVDGAGRSVFSPKR